MGHQEGRTSLKHALRKSISGCYENMELSLTSDLFGISYAPNGAFVVLVSYPTVTPWAHWCCPLDKEPIYIHGYIVVSKVSPLPMWVPSGGRNLLAHDQIVGDECPHYPRSVRSETY